MDAKSFLASKTLWVNLIAGIAAVSGAFGLDLGLTTDAQTAIVGGVMAIVNIILRFTTTQPIALTTTSTPPAP